MMTHQHIDWQPSDLANEIVKLVPLSAGDFEVLYEVASDPLIWEQHPANNRYQREVFQVYFEEAMAENKAFLIVEQAEGKVIGASRYYNFDGEDASIAIGYTFIARQYWGGLHNKASKRLLLDYAFQYVDKVYFHIGAMNMRSQLAIKKIGAKEVRQYISEVNSRKVPHIEYVVLKKDWIQESSAKST